MSLNFHDEGKSIHKLLTKQLLEIDMFSQNKFELQHKEEIAKRVNFQK